MSEHAIPPLRSRDYSPTARGVADLLQQVLTAVQALRREQAATLHLLEGHLGDRKRAVTAGSDVRFSPPHASGPVGRSHLRPPASKPPNCAP